MARKSTHTRGERRRRTWLENHPSPTLRADLRLEALKRKYNRETVQYVRFPAGPPREYWTRPWLLSFGDRTGSGVSNQV